jgi:hypothetical protein
MHPPAFFLKRRENPMFENSGWLLVVAGGPIIIAAAFLYAYMNRRRLTRQEKAEQHEAVQELYEDTPVDRARKAREQERV